jgi:hypothetical protein
MARDKTKVAHPLVPSQLWHGGGQDPQDNELQLRDPINQIADFLDDAGFANTLAALKQEAKGKHIVIDLDAWREFGRDPDDVWQHTLMQMWKRIARNERLKTFILGEERAEERAEKERELAAKLSEDSSQAAGGALLDVEAEETGSSCDSGSVKAGQKRKRILTPSSTDDDSSDSDSESDSSSNKMKDGSSSSNSSSDSDSDSESSEDDDRPLKKRTKLSNTEDDSAKAGASSDSEEDDDKPLVKKSKPARGYIEKRGASSDSDSDSSSDSSSGEAHRDMRHLEDMIY